MSNEKTTVDNVFLNSKTSSLANQESIPLKDNFSKNPSQSSESEDKPLVVGKAAAGVTYKQLADIEMPIELRNQLTRDLELFKSTGSMSGGKITTEFINIDDLKENLEKKGLDKIKSGLAMTPVNLGLILTNSYRMIGANDQGKFIGEKGWLGFFQIYKDTNSESMVELSEAQIETEMGDSVQEIIEFVNYQISGYNATIQSLKSDKAEYIFTIHWSVNERTFHLSTKNLSKQQAIETAEKITAQFKTLPNGGWKVPYELDVNSLQFLRKQYGVKN